MFSLSYLLDSQMVQKYDLGTYSRSPFKFNRLAQDEQDNLLDEIKETMDDIVSESFAVVVKPIRTWRPEKISEMKSPITIPTAVMTKPPESPILPPRETPIMPKIMSITGAKLGNLNSFITDRLPPPTLVWQTKKYGILSKIVGRTHTEIFRLWSADPAQNISCQYDFVYFPTQLLLNGGNDIGLIYCYKETAQFARVVPHEGHVGYVRVDENGYKIKTFARNKVKESSDEQSTTFHSEVKLATMRMPIRRLVLSELFAPLPIIKEREGDHPCHLLVAESPVDKDSFAEHWKTLQRC